MKTNLVPAVRTAVVTFMAGVKRGKEQEHCGKCIEGSCSLKEQLITEFNALVIDDMEKVTDLNALKGDFINLEYNLPSGQAIKFWNDDRIYLGNQIRKKNSDRCYGLAVDEKLYSCL